MSNVKAAMEYAAKLDRDALEYRLNRPTLLWYDPTNQHVSTDKGDPLFTPLGQLWPLDVKREWVGLKAEEINHIFAANAGYPERMMQEVANLLKEKNGG